MIKGASLERYENHKDHWNGTNLPEGRNVHPFPTNYVQQVLGAARRKIAIENNYSAQMAGLIREKTGIGMDNTIVKFDGRPFSQNEIYEGVKDIIKNGIKEVTVSHA